MNSSSKRALRPRHKKREMARVTEELALMARGTLALFRRSADVEPLIDADHKLELSRNTQLAASPIERQEQSRLKRAETVNTRLCLLRRNIGRSFLILISAVALALMFVGLVSAASASSRVWLGASSMFCFAWATLARLGWSGQSFKGDTVVERLDERIFKSLYWIAIFLGTLALV